MSSLVMYIHLSHQYDWHHFIDTIIQVYRIVGLEIKLKAMCMSSWRLTSLCLLQHPYSAARVLLKKANLSFVLT